MSQYHYLVNVSRREFLNPHKLGEGLALGQISNSWISSLLVCLLCDSYQGPGCKHHLMGRWANCQVVIASDDPATGAKGNLYSLRSSHSSIHEACDEEPAWTEVSGLVKEHYLELPLWLHQNVIEAEELIS